MNRKLKIILCLVGIFLAGAATGAFVGLRIERSIASRHSPMDSFVPRQMERLTQQLDLTPEQKEKVQAILRKSAEEMRVIRRDSFQATSAKVRECNAEIVAVLTPEQAKQFEEVIRSQRERIRRFQQERGEGRRGPGDGSRKEPPPEPPPPGP